MLTTLIFLAGCMLAYANGANDNFKGVATLFGSGTSDYRRALAWATVTTLLGSLLAVALGAELLRRFGGRGIVPDELAAEPRYLAAVALAAGSTVLLATRLALPISTTHALVGGLCGAAFAAASSVAWTVLAKNFFAPLLLSPLLAVAGAAAFYPLLHWGRCRLAVTKETCLCVGTETIERVGSLSPALVLERTQQLTASIGTTVTCQERYQGRLLGVGCGQAMDALHYLSAGWVSFARGLNDTPKIAALLMAAPWLGSLPALVLTGVVIGVGGLVSARRVAETMSHRITGMNPGQGLTANLITGLLVVLASLGGLPVSTTHVSCGSLFGIGAVTGRAQWSLIARILAAWLTTLPLAGLLGWAAYTCLKSVG